MISALLVATHIINFQGNLRKFVKDLSGPTHPTTQYSGLLDCFPLDVSAKASNYVGIPENPRNRNNKNWKNAVGFGG